MKMKKMFALALTLVMAASAMVSCGNDNGSSSSSSANNSSSTVEQDSSGEETTGMSGKIAVIAREEGSGTRSAFVELLGIVDADENDATIPTAEATNSTSVMMTTEEGNKNAIGYISLGSLQDNVKAVSVDGVEPTTENVKNGTYTISRPFNIATKEGLSEVASDFVTFILSEEGQAIIDEEGYISVTPQGSYTAGGLSGNITLGGSTSVSPVMEKLAEAYKALNPDVTIEIQQTGSSAGMTAAIEGVCDIGMASREVSQSELDQGLTSTQIAMDGIAVIVNNENPTENMTSEQIQKIYLGEITDWSEIQ